MSVEKGDRQRGEENGERKRDDKGEEWENNKIRRRKKKLSIITSVYKKNLKQFMETKHKWKEN